MKLFIFRINEQRRNVKLSQQTWIACYKYNAIIKNYGNMHTWETKPHIAYCFKRETRRKKVEKLVSLFSHDLASVSCKGHVYIYIWMSKLFTSSIKCQFNKMTALSKSSKNNSARVFISSIDIVFSFFGPAYKNEVTHKSKLEYPSKEQ